jgi:hypothetical protein
VSSKAEVLEGIRCAGRSPRGWPAFLGVIAIFWLMVMKPV